MISPFAGISLIVVEPGHELYDDMTDTTHVVEKGNMVRQGARKVLMVQDDYDAIKAHFAPQEAPND